MFERNCVVKPVDSFGVEHAAKVEAKPAGARSVPARMPVSRLTDCRGSLDTPTGKD